MLLLKIIKEKLRGCVESALQYVSGDPSLDLNNLSRDQAVMISDVGIGAIGGVFALTPLAIGTIVGGPVVGAAILAGAIVGGCAGLMFLPVPEVPGVRPGIFLGAMAGGALSGIGLVAGAIIGGIGVALGDQGSFALERFLNKKFYSLTVDPVRGTRPKASAHSIIRGAWLSTALIFTASGAGYGLKEATQLSFPKQTSVEKKNDVSAQFYRQSLKPPVVRQPKEAGSYGF